MCDYSLYALPNRLAEDGEQVVLYKFGTGSIGFASTLDAASQKTVTCSRWDEFCADLKALLLPRSTACVPAVCMPPGTRLMLGDVPVRIQAEHSLRAGDTVTVTEITTQSYAYRDALFLPNGKCVLLQELPAGMEATVLSTALEPVEQREHAYAYVRRYAS
ncbi:MAG TPA: hypothetical protein VH302_15540 [Bryobacteraceae bacterium]|nr:hypothetical protein [Bryobacteraceae bacterium]